MLSKAQYTLQIYHQLGEHAPETVEVAMTTWWQDHRGQSGFRLSDIGYVAFVTAGIQSYEFELRDQQIRPVTFVTLNRKMQSPYYLVIQRRGSRIIMFGSHEATMFALYGNIDRFVRALREHE